MSNARDDMDSVLDEGIRAAIYFLEKRGEFFPFAVAMSCQGELKHTQGYTDEEQPESNAVIALLRQGLMTDARAGSIVSCGVITDVRIRQPDTEGSTDAIRVEIEHAAAEPVTCYLPYRLESREVIRGEIMAERGKPLIMGKSQ